MPSVDPGPIRLALCGESPGADECALGRPFCGKSGWLLDQWLASAGISRSQCFVGNVVQVRPSPTSNDFHLFEWNESRVQEGIAALREDLARFRPHCVVALGNAALHLLKQGNVSPGKSAKLGLFQWVSHVGTWRGSLFRAAASFDAFEAADLRVRSGRCPVIASDAPTTIYSPSPVSLAAPCAKSLGSSVNQAASARDVIDGNSNVAVAQAVTAGRDPHQFPAPPHSNADAATSTSPPMPSILPNASGINELRAGPATNPVQASVTVAGGSLPCASESFPPTLDPLGSGQSRLCASNQPSTEPGGSSRLGAGMAEGDARALVLVDRGNAADGRSVGMPVSNPASSAAPLTTYKAMATYHPAATFREPSFVFPLVSDLKRAVAEARTPELVLPERRIRWGLSIEELEGECEGIRKRRAPVGHDIEGGLGGLHCASFAITPADAFVVDLMALHGDGPRTYAAIASVLEDENVPKVLWNAAYERAIWEAVAGVIIRNYEDGMIAWWERFSELPKGLDFVASILTREPYWAEGIGWDKRTGMPKVLGPPFLTYNALDSMTTIEIWQSKLIREVVESRTPVAFTT